MIRLLALCGTCISICECASASVPRFFNCAVCIVCVSATLLYTATRRKQLSFQTIIYTSSQPIGFLNVQVPTVNSNAVKGASCSSTYEKMNHLHGQQQTVTRNKSNRPFPRRGAQALSVTLILRHRPRRGISLDSSSRFISMAHVIRHIAHTPTHLHIRVCT
jgi:hypothetical protein